MIHSDAETSNVSTHIGEERPPPVRIAVAGLYRSGSTAIAGILHRLGVDMGPPFYENYYESFFLSAQLRLWWQEPFIIERVSSEHRVQLLKQWISQSKMVNAKAVGAKHPLFCLCCDDILSAWGHNTRFVWAYRSLETSVASLARQGWWHPLECRRVQEILWEEANLFFSKNNHFRLEYEELVREPIEHIKKVTEFLNLNSTEKEIQAAAEFILSHN